MAQNFKKISNMCCSN